MSKRRPIAASDAQLNAEALARRSAPYTAASELSVRIAWDWRQREPKDLRDAVDLVRKAYADEVPTKLHEGPDSIGDDGTPRMTSRAEGYIFGGAQSDDAAVIDQETRERELVGYYHTPFRALLSRMERGDALAQRRAAIVRHVTIGSQGPATAAIQEKAHPLDAKLVAWDALRAFLRELSDIRLHIGKRTEPLAETTTAA